MYMHAHVHWSLLNTSNNNNNNNNNKTTTTIIPGQFIKRHNGLFHIKGTVTMRYLVELKGRLKVELTI